MKRGMILAAVVGAVLMGSADDAGAVGPGGPSPFGFGFQPFGFYQPYGATYQSRIQTPPYFSLNPPVYYGARYSRPYGMSPFASPPVVAPSANYRGRLHPGSLSPIPPTPAPARRLSPCGNPFCQTDSDASALRTPPVMSVAGSDDRPSDGVQSNPFVSTQVRVASR